MKLIVKEKARDFRLRFPTSLLLNRVTAFVICRKVKKHGTAITYRQTVGFIKALHTYRRAHKEWVLVEVKGAKGTYVQIKL